MWYVCIEGEVAGFHDEYSAAEAQAEELAAENPEYEVEVISAERMAELTED